MWPDMDPAVVAAGLALLAGMAGWLIDQLVR